MRWGIITIYVLVFAGCFFPPAAYAETILGENEVVDRVLVAAPSVLKANEELGIFAGNVMTSKSVFDTYLSGDSNYSRDEFEKNSSFYGTRKDMANWDMGLTKKMPFGTSTSLNWTNDREQLFGVPTISGSTIFPTTPTYESALSFSLSHPLMKNFAGMNDRSTVNQAKKSYESADLQTKYQIASIAKEALNYYWQWVISGANQKVWQRAVRDATHFLDITLEREKLGTAEKTDVLAARANLISRENSLLAAKRLSIRIEKDLKVLLGFSEHEEISATDGAPREINNYITDKNEAISVALANRWDYHAQKKTVERYNLKVVSTKNQRWPELNLVGTLAVNGLDSSYSEAITDVNHPYWGAGITLSIPLENRMARGDYKKARHEKAKAVIELKNMENDISNSIVQLIETVKINREVLNNAKSAEEMQSEKLKEEMKKYGYGRSNSELVILYQDDLVRSQDATLWAWYDYIGTILNLKLAENTLID